MSFYAFFFFDLRCILIAYLVNIWFLLSFNHGSAGFDSAIMMFFLLLAVIWFPSLFFSFFTQCKRDVLSVDQSSLEIFSFSLCTQHTKSLSFSVSWCVIFWALRRLQWHIDSKYFRGLVPKVQFEVMKARRLPKKSRVESKNCHGKPLNDSGPKPLVQLLL